MKSFTSQPPAIRTDAKHAADMVQDDRRVGKGAGEVDRVRQLRMVLPGFEAEPQLFERLNEEFGSDAWLVGRVTGQEYTKRNAYPEHADQTYLREPWLARHNAQHMGSYSMRTARSPGAARTSAAIRSLSC